MTSLKKQDTASNTDFKRPYHKRFRNKQNENRRPILLRWNWPTDVVRAIIRSELVREVGPGIKPLEQHEWKYNLDRPMSL